jgi:hypothetical protein
MKIVDFGETYNFVVQTYSIWNYLEAQIIGIIKSCRLFEPQDDFIKKFELQSCIS